MRRLLCMVALAMFVSCTGREPVGLDASALAPSASKQVVVSPSAATLEIGQTQQFSAQLIQDGKQKKAAFTWSSSNTAVATVSATGLVTCTGSGDATITATASMGTSGTAHVTGPQAPPQVVATIPLAGGAFGSIVSNNFTAFVGEPNAGAVQRLDLASLQVTGTGSTVGGFPVQLSSNAAGTRLYVANFGGLVASLDTGSMAIVDSVRVGGDAYGITATPAGDTVFVGITNGPIYKIDLRAGTVLGVLDLPVAAGYHFEWNKNRTRLYAAQRAFDGGRVFEIEPNAFTLLRTFETGGSAQGIQLSADDSKLFVAAQDGGIIVWDVATNSQITTYATPGCSGYGLLRTPNDAFLLVGCVFEGLVQVLNPNTGALITTLNVGGRPRELSFDAASRSVVVPNESGWVDILR